MQHPRVLMEGFAFQFDSEGSFSKVFESSLTFFIEFYNHQIMRKKPKAMIHECILEYLKKARSYKGHPWDSWVNVNMDYILDNIMSVLNVSRVFTVLQLCRRITLVLRRQRQEYLGWSVMMSTTYFQKIWQPSEHFRGKEREHKYGKKCLSVNNNIEGTDFCIFFNSSLTQHGIWHGIYLDKCWLNCKNNYQVA